MNLGELWRKFTTSSRAASDLPDHLRRGRAGELAAKTFLQKQGLKFLFANFTAKRGEIDLVFRDNNCLVFVEVKTRAPGGWTRPSRAVNRAKKKRLTLSALEYLRRIRNPEVPIRFDIVEVLMADDLVTEIRHLPNTFTLTPPYRYGA